MRLLQLPFLGSKSLIGRQRAIVGGVRECKVNRVGGVMFRRRQRVVIFIEGADSLQQRRVERKKSVSIMYLLMPSFIQNEVSTYSQKKRCKFQQNSSFIYVMLYSMASCIIILKVDLVTNLQGNRLKQKGAYKFIIYYRAYEKHSYARDM